MKRSRSSFAFVSLLALALGACGEKARDENRALGGSAAARVDDQPIDLSVVATVAAAQKISPRDAAKKIIDDEIAALAARKRSIDKQASVLWRFESTRARFAADRFLEEARRGGPPTDEEVNILSERHWAQVDRPPSVHVMHALVVLPKDKALAGRARSLSRDLRSAVADVSNADFESRAQAFPTDSKIQIKVEDLPAFTEEGWVVTEANARMDTTFAKAAVNLPSIGATSEVVETSFGFHVIRLLERFPEVRMPFESRRIAFIEETYRMRARNAMTARLKAIGATNEVVISPAADQLMRAVKFEGPPQ